MLKNTTDDRVLPGSTAITVSPSRTRVDATSFTSFCRFTQPSRDTMHDVVFLDDEVFGRVLGLAFVARNARPARIAVLLLDFLDLDADDVPAAVLVLQQRVDLAHAAAAILELLSNQQNLEPRQAVDLQFEDRVGLFRIEIEPLDDLLRGIRLAFRLAHDLQNVVERIEDLLEALENVDAFLDRRQLVLQPSW